MISDVLHDASEQINRYLVEMPESYADLTAEIIKLVEAMDAMRIVLDRFPEPLN